MCRHALVLSVTLFSLAPAHAAELRGKVLQADGTPAAGATVWAAAVFVQPPLRHETVTDAQGEFRLELKPLKEPQRWAVRARLGRQGGEANDAYGSVKVAEGKAPAPVVIRMTERGVLRGRLLQAEDDRPIASGRLYLDTGEVLRTDADGRFTTGGLPLKNHDLIPVAGGRVRQYVLFDTSLRPDAELDIRLARGGKFTGRVLDENGKPILGAYVTRASSGNALTLNGWDETCDADGRFVYDGVSVERLFYGVQAAAPGYTSEEHRYPAVREGEPSPVYTFRLKREVSPAAVDAPRPDRQKPAEARLPRRDLAGVVSAPGKKPLADVLVRWGATEYEETERETRTDENGRFKLLDVPDRDGYLTVIVDGYAPRFPRAPQGDRQMAVELEEGETVRGVVRSKTGRALEGVQVILVLPSPDPSLGNPLWLKERQTYTDAQGRFAIRGLPRDRVRFDVLHQGWSELRNLQLELGGRENQVEMGAVGAVRGVVLDPDGKPVRNFRIRVQIPRVQHRNEKVGGYYAGYEWYGITFTADDGVFVISDVSAGTWLRLQAIAPGYGQAVIDRVQAQPLDELPPARELTLRLVPAHALRIRAVAEKGGAPIADAVVTLIDGPPEMDSGPFSWGYGDLWGLRGRTDKDGWAVFPKLEFGEATVLVTRPGYARGRWGWRLSQKELRIPLAPEAVVTGTVRMGQRPFKDCWVRLQTATGDSITGTVGEQGEFRIDQLPAGDYTFTVHGERQELYKKALTLKAGESREVAVEVAPPGQ